MSYAARLEAQNNRIRKLIAVQSTTVAGNREFITENLLLTAWMQHVGDDSKTELDEFQECVPSPDLARNLYQAIKTISILICIHWSRWEQFAERFCRLTDEATLDDLQDLDDRLPFPKDQLVTHLFPDDLYYANNFFLQQYVFLPLILEEHQPFASYGSESRLPLLDDDSNADPTAHHERIVAVRVAEGHFRFAKGGEMNSTPHPLRRKMITNGRDVEREIQNLSILKNSEELSDRIMRHVVALRLGSDYHIFYDEAELDLETLLKGGYGDCYPDDAMAPQSLVTQAWYLAGAIDFLHFRLFDRRAQLLCCHMDLKPANILISRHKDLRAGKWALTDFAVAVIGVESPSGYSASDAYGKESQTLASITSSTWYPSDFQPPEAERGGQMGQDSNEPRKGNIWSFGCILTALLLFSVGGAPLVQRLHDVKYGQGQSPFFYALADSGARVKDKVTQWAAQMSQHQGPWALEWLKLICDGMLQISKTHRLEAKQVQEQLDPIWRRAPTENVWHNLPRNPELRSLSPGWAESTRTGRRPSGVSFLSSNRLSTIRASTPELVPATGLGRDQNQDFAPPPPPPDFTPSGHRRSDSTEGTISSGSAQSLPTDQMSLNRDLPSANDLSICADDQRFIFWNGQNMIPYIRNSDPWEPDVSSFDRENLDPTKLELTVKSPTAWTDVSLSGSYLALVKSCPAIQIKVIELDKRELIQPHSGWPSFQGLSSASVSSQGSLALFYDRIVKFRSTGDNSHLQSSSWSIKPENVCSASFSPDGNKFYAVSWNKLWIARIEQDKWILKASGDHNLSAKTYISFQPYLVPFTTHEALLAHNPAEDQLRYLEAGSSTRVELGAGLIRVALSASEDVLIWIRRLQRTSRRKLLPQPFYGLSWRTIRRSQARALILGADRDTVDLNISEEKNKKFSLTSNMEDGILTAWVVTSRGEIRKCRLV